jgi:DNA-directed RNA polymerase specialized sigma24 family protein
MLARYDHGRGTLEGLLAISFRNFVVSELRTRRNAPELLVDKESLEGVAANAEFERTLQHDDVRKALNRLPSQTARPWMRSSTPRACGEQR